MSSKSKRLVSLFLSVLMVVGIIAVGFVTAHAEINDAVRTDTNGIFEIRSRISVTGTYAATTNANAKTYNKEDIGYYAGTCFLINEKTVLTCAHVVNPDTIKDDIKSMSNGTLTVDSIVYQLVINKDVTVSCTLKNLSAQDDYAILTLDDAVGGKDILKLGDSSTAAPTQRVYALGFPENITDFQTAADSSNIAYDKDDVTITEGEIQKVTNINNTDVIQHGCVTSNGNSGGPIVDEKGNVLGIHKWSLNNDNSYHYATAINEVKKVLDSLMIDYESADDADDEEETTEAEESQTEVLAIASSNSDDSKETVAAEKSSDSLDITKLIIIIAIVVLVIVIAVVVVILILNSKKKKGNKNQAAAAPQVGGRQSPTQLPYGQQAQMPQQTQMPQQAQVQQQTQRQYQAAPPQAPAAPMNDGAGETSVLNDGAGETTVLGGGGAQAGFSMLRRKNNENISINKPEFLIGKERRRVDYCITDNNSVSRAHAKIKVRAGRCYISDLGSTNCTYVNGVKLSPNQEVILSKGDRIKISDEEFEFLG